MASEDAADTTAQSKVERIKRDSRGLRGTIAESLAGPDPKFGGDDQQLLKFHGIYQQDDRDARRAHTGEEKSYSFMIRVVIPAGSLSASQYLELDRLADNHANGTLRITTRQGIQYHGVLKGDMRPTIAAINAALMTTLAACGDVERNVMGCPTPADGQAQRTVHALARDVTARLRPATAAYHEIWVDGSKVATSEPMDPVYGETYLPRKFKTGIALTTDNCVDVFAQDAGLIGIVENGRADRWLVTVGGGLGMTHNKGDTIARLADAVGVVETQDAVESIAIIAAIFRDHGNRADRRYARIKYLIESWGIDKFRGEFRRRAAFTVGDVPELPPIPFHDHLDRVRQDNGRWTFGVFVLSGRVADTATLRLKSALQQIAREVGPRFVFTPQQSVLLADLDDAGLASVEAILRSHGVETVASLSGARRYSMACPALPTCGLALAESERTIPGILNQLDATLEQLGLRDAPFTLRMTGCPNGCARPYTADIAFVGRSADLYHVYVGGRLEGDRVADLYAADVPAKELLPCVTRLLERWARERSLGEGLGDFYHRALGSSGIRRKVTGRELPTLPRMFPA